MACVSDRARARIRSHASAYALVAHPSHTEALRGVVACADAVTRSRDRVILHAFALAHLLARSLSTKIDILEKLSDLSEMITGPQW